nr:phospholipase-like protein [Tanacetum cinerariifolium]
MHTFYQRYPSEQHWTKDHPLEQVIGNPSQSVRTRRQLESNAEMCMFVLTGCLDNLSKGRSGFRDRVFSGVARVKGIEIYKVLHSQTDFNNLLDDDVVRVCLLLALDFVFMGFELRHVILNELLNLVDDFSAWDNFPWGQHIWAEFHNAKSRFKRQVVRTEVSREVHVRTEVSREVYVRTDVHHYVDEGLSVKDLVKKIGDMQRGF